ncbi:MAG: hypothetical protein M1484_02890 [Patescibacteria group bacterium]|nr:hypothetical protein [Patescibacteria group bacterium]
MSSLIFPSKILAAPAIVHDLTNSSEYNIRIDGPITGGYLSYGGHLFADLDGGGKADDLVVVLPYASYNGRANSGSVYVITDSILNKLSGTGNTLDLLNSANYNLRVDGVATLTSGLGFAGNIASADIDGDGKNDLLLGESGTSNGSIQVAGSLYIIYNSTFGQYLSSTGNILDLATVSSYNIRIDGGPRVDNPSFGSLLSSNSVLTANIFGNGRDVVVSAVGGNLETGRNFNGGVYVFSNYLLKQFSGTGNVINLATSNNFTLRMDGPASNSRLGGPQENSIIAKDLTGTGYDSIIIPSKKPSPGLYFISSNLLRGVTSTSTGNILDLATSTNYSLFIQNSETSFVSIGPLIATDLYSTGKYDIVVDAYQASNNGKSQSGSNYIFPYSIYGQYLSTTGNVLNVSSSSYSLRFDGAFAGDWLGDVSNNHTDFFHLGKQDLILGGPHNHRTDGGSLDGAVYIIPNSKINSFSGTGNSLDLSTAGSSSMVYYGPSGTHLEYSVIADNGGFDGIMADANMAGYNSRTNSGSLYIIYNFPHSINLTSSGKDKIVGTVSAPNSVTSVSGVQYNYNSNDPTSSGWTNCSGTTSFTCTLSNFPSGSSNKVYIRAFDTNGSYTAQSSYALANFVDSTGTSSGPADPNCKSNYAYCINAGPNYLGSFSQIKANGAFVSTTSQVNHDDLHISVNQTSLDSLSSFWKTILTAGKSDVSYTMPKDNVPFPWSQGFNTVSEIYSISAASAFNGYPVLITDNPFTIQLTYESTKLNSHSPQDIKFAYYDNSRNKWMTLSAPTVVDWANHTIATTTKIFSLYALVYPSGSSNTPVLGTETKNNKPIVLQTPTIVPSPIQTSKPVNPPKQKHCFLFICW